MILWEIVCILQGSTEEPPNAGQSNNSLRDKMLKPGYEFPDSHDNEKNKVDADLDGRYEIL